MIALLLGWISLAFVGPQQDLVRRATGGEPFRPMFPAGTELRVHDVAELTGYARLAALETELAGLPAGGDPARALEVLERIAARRTEAESIAKGLLETVRDRMTPELEAPQRLELLGGGRLALLGLAEQQAWLEAFLSGVASFLGLIDVQVRVYEVPRGALPEAFGGRSGRTLAPGEAAELVGRLAQKEFDPTIAPRVLTFPFRETSLSVVEQIPYVSDFEIKVLPDQETEVADPIIAVAEDGTRVVLRFVPAPGEGLTVYAEVDHTRVARPIPSHAFELASGTTVEVQLPAITHVKVEGRFELAAGESVLLMAPADPEEKTEVLVLLQARRVPEQAAGGR